MEQAVNKWFAVEITCVPAASEAIEYAFNQLDALGTEIAFAPVRNLEPLRVSGFFQTPPDTGELNHNVAEALRIYDFQPDAILGIKSSEVEQTDWLAEWKKHWKPTVIGRFVIAPPWEPVADDGRIVILIEPNMAFGTGTHETTKLCSRKIDEIYRPQQTLLDVGTGTGILAIAAAKLGGKRIFACDTDLDSVAIARENAVLNNVADAIEYTDGPIGDDTPTFGFVCANLTLDVILPILDLLLAKTGEILLLSGILAEQSEQITAALKERHVTEFEIDTDGEWISVLIRAG